MEKSYKLRYKTAHPPYTNPTNPDIRKLAMQTADEIEVELDKHLGTTLDFKMDQILFSFINATTYIA